MMTFPITGRRGRCAPIFHLFPPLVATLALALFPSPLAARGSDAGEFHWRGDAHELTELPADLGEAPRAALETWGAWATESGYRLELSPDGRVLLILRAKRTPKKELELVAETVERFDEILPAPPRELDGTPLRSAADAPAASRIDANPSWNWIQNGPAPDTETIVLLRAQNSADYSAAIDRIVADEPWMAGWAAAGKSQGGFVFERPLCAAWLEDGPGLEEHDPQNELVHRLARLLTLRRFGQQAWWMTLGIAWHFEIELRGGVYCFPYRNGFVGRAEHGAWPKKLGRLAKQQGDGIALATFADWDRGSWEDESAVLSWGVAAHLAKHYPEVLPLILENYRILYNAKGIERGADGSWNILVDYRPSIEDQEEILRFHLGDEFAAEMKEAFAKGRRWKKPR